MKTGVVKFFNTTKGYGFIREDASGQEIFVHITGLGREGERINEGDKVEFEVDQGRKGANAVNVRRIEG